MSENMNENSSLDEKKNMLNHTGDPGVESSKNDSVSIESDTERKPKKKKTVTIILVSILTLLVLAYLGTAYYFKDHFYLFTKINGQECSAKTIKEVEDKIQDKVGKYVLTLEKNDGTTETITGKDIKIEYQPKDELKKAMEKQNPFLWPKAFFKADKFEFPVGIGYDNDLLLQKIDALSCVADPEQVQPVSAKPVYDGTNYVIEPEVMGNTINKEVLVSTIQSMITESKSTINLNESGCYYLPQYYADSAEVVAANDKLNAYLKTSVTYDFKPYTETLNGQMISEWLVVDENMNVSLQTDKIKEYIASLANKYDTAGKPRSFVTATGATVQVSNGAYGWKINRAEEYNKLLANIEAHETVTREPVYARKAISHEGNDFGNTYAEVDLSGQQMWFIQNGQIVLQSPVVTGNPNQGHATPQGTYTVSYTTRDAVLKGRIMPDGTREYESPVKYWMPFNGGIGFHDASWQTAFGGTRYQTHGSHGCINMPLDKAQQLFGYLKAGTPVICHY